MIIDADGLYITTKDLDLLRCYNLALLTPNKCVPSSTPLPEKRPMSPSAWSRRRTSLAKCKSCLFFWKLHPFGIASRGLVQNQLKSSTANGYAGEWVCIHHPVPELKPLRTLREVVVCIWSVASDRTPIFVALQHRIKEERWGATQLPPLQDSSAKNQTIA